MLKNRFIIQNFKKFKYMSTLFIMFKSVVYLRTLACVQFSEFLLEAFVNRIRWLK